MTLFDGGPIHKYCLVYCGDDRCNCQKSPRYRDALLLDGGPAPADRNEVRQPADAVGAPEGPLPSPAEVEGLVDRLADTAIRLGRDQIHSVHDALAADESRSRQEFEAARTALLSRLSTPPDLIQAAREAEEAADDAVVAILDWMMCEGLMRHRTAQNDGLLIRQMILRALQSSTPSWEGASGRRPDGHGLSSSGPGPTVPAPAGASIPGAGDLTAQVADQCKVVAHLARALARVHDDYATLATERVFTSIMHDVGQRSAELMEMLGEALNNMDATSTEDEWTDPIFEAAQIAFPIRARDQRAEREDAQRPRPEAASPIDDANSGGEALGGWQPTDTAPMDTEVEVRTGLMAFRAKLVPGAGMTENEQLCDQWQATREGEHPPCWSDGACWSSNADHCPSMQPEAWRPVPFSVSPRPSREETGDAL